MISSLPPELLALIIESTVPHTFHSTTYRDRQRTLCSLSLVSKTFRSIAQPLLLEIVWIRSPEQLDLVPARGGQDRLGGLRVPCIIVTFGVCSRPKGVTDAELITEVVKRFPSLSSLLWGHEASTDPELAFLYHLYSALPRAINISGNTDALPSSQICRHFNFRVSDHLSQTRVLSPIFVR